VVFVFDCGWGREILSQAAACVGHIEQLLDVNEDFEIVVGGSSFPDSFAKQGERIVMPMIERLLFQEVRRNLNRGDLFYGDWGSTRPPSDPVPMKNVPRIDFALPGQWIAHRSGGDESYNSLAGEVLEDDAWADGLGIWGEYMIESTAAGLDPSIKSPAMAAAVRVNLHMHIQANFDDPADMVVADEPFED
jgi:Beta protein